MSCELMGSLECKTCKAEFYRFSHLQDHILKKHINAEYVCIFCSYKSDNEPEIKTHEDRHSGYPPVTRCPYCAWGDGLIEVVKEHVAVYHVCKY